MADDDEGREEDRLVLKSYSQAEEDPGVARAVKAEDCDQTVEPMAEEFRGNGRESGSEESEEEDDGERSTSPRRLESPHHREEQTDYVAGGIPHCQEEQPGYIFGDNEICPICVLEEEAVAFCKQCNTLLCDACLTHHGNRRDTRDHELIERPSAERIRGKYNCTNPAHSNKPAEYFCVDCDKPICQHCYMDECRDHEKILAHDVKAEMKLLLRGVEANLTAFNEHAEYVQKVISDNEDAFQEAVDCVNKTFRTLFDALEAKRDDILSFLRKMTVENQQRNEEELMCIRQACDGMNTTIQETEVLLTVKRDPVLTVNKIVACAKLEDKVMRTWDPKRAAFQAWQLDHIGERDFSSRFCRLIPKPKVQDIIVSGLANREARVGVTNTFTVAIRNIRNQLREFSNMEARSFLSVKILFEGTENNGTSTVIRHDIQLEDDAWTVSFYLRMHGRVTIFLLVCSLEVENQPFVLTTNPNRVELKVGDQVVRGPDWQWGDMDGGPGGKGKVMRAPNRGWVAVRWDSDPNGIGDCRWGDKDRYDLKVVFRR